MNLSFTSWGSPVGLGLFFIGLGIFFRLFSAGLVALLQAKHANESKRDGATHGHAAGPAAASDRGSP